MGIEIKNTKYITYKNIIVLPHLISKDHVQTTISFFFFLSQFRFEVHKSIQ